MDEEKKQGVHEGKEGKKEHMEGERASTNSLVPKTAQNPSDGGPSFEGPRRSARPTMPGAVTATGKDNNKLDPSGYYVGPSYEDQVNETTCDSPVIAAPTLLAQSIEVPSSTSNDVLKQEILNRRYPEFRSVQENAPSRGALAMTEPLPTSDRCHLPAFKDQSRIALPAEHTPVSSLLPYRQRSSSPGQQDQTMTTEREDDENGTIREALSGVAAMKYPKLVEAELVDQNRPTSSGRRNEASIYEAEIMDDLFVLNRRRLVLIIVTLLVIVGVVLGGVCGSNLCKQSSSYSLEQNSSSSMECARVSPVSEFNTTTNRYLDLRLIFGFIYGNGT